MRNINRDHYLNPIFYKKEPLFLAMFKSRKGPFISIFLFFLLQMQLVGQTTTNLTVVEDNSISNASGGSGRNYGTCEDLEIKGALSYPTLLFDLSSIPAGATIISATLKVNKSGGEPQDVGAHRITTAWADEGPECNTSGTPNWSAPWTNSGGDYASPAESTTSFTLTNGIYSWDVTTLTQNWIDGTFANYGVQLVPTTQVSGIHTIDSKEKVGGIAPELVVVYSTISLTNTVTDNICAATPTGAVDLTVTGGTAPFLFNWSNGITTEDLSGIAGGTYYVTVTDNTGLMAFDTAIVAGPTAMDLTTSVTHVSSAGGSTGAIDLTVTGGTSPYTYSWSNSETTEDISGLVAGTYTVTVTDNCMATAILSVEIAELENKYLYLTDAYGLDRIDPVATADNTTSTSVALNQQVEDNGTITDDFSSGTYTGGSSTGTRTWSGDWMENDASGGGATGGEILISSNTLLFNESLNDDIYRTIDLSDATAASISFDIDETVSGSDLIVFEASNDGGSTYTNLDSYDFNVEISSRTYDLVALLGSVSANTRIRFRWTASGNSSANFIIFDNFSITYTVPPLGTPDTTFVQGVPMCSDFNILAGEDIVVSAYSNVTAGTMPANPDIIAVLEYGAGPTLIDTLKNPAWDAGTGLLTWTDQLSSDILVPTGEAISLTIITNETVTTFEIQYDSDTYPSKIQLPTSTYIAIEDIAIYDAPYSGGTIITETEAGMTVYVRATASDPFGFDDITSMDFDFINSLNDTTTATATSVATAGCTSTYEYAWTTPTTNAGDYGVRAIGYEGTEGVIGDSTIQFTIISPIGITKSIVSPTSAPYTVGDNISYKILIDNKGTTGVSTTPIQDIYDAGCLQFVSASPAENSISNGTIIWNDLGALGAGEKDSITVTFTIIANCDPTINIANMQGAMDAGGNAIALKTDTVSINIDEPPVANEDEFCVSAPQDLDVLANDTDPDADLTTVTITVPPSVGTTTVNPDNTVQYTPGAGMVDNDSDSFTYQICDNAPVTPYCSTATVTVVYSTTNDAPVLTDDFASTTLDLPFTFSVVKKTGHCQSFLLPMNEQSVKLIIYFY